MNERIKELIGQCEDFGTWENKTYTFDKEKFAELIIRECADHIDDLITCNDDGNQILECDDVRTELLEHFGVEE